MREIISNPLNPDTVIRCVDSMIGSGIGRSASPSIGTVTMRVRELPPLSGVKRFVRVNVQLDMQSVDEIDRYVVKLTEEKLTSVAYFNAELAFTDRFDPEEDLDRILRFGHNFYGAMFALVVGPKSSEYEDDGRCASIFNDVLGQLGLSDFARVSPEAHEIVLDDHDGPARLKVLGTSARDEKIAALKSDLTVLSLDWHRQGGWRTLEVHAGDDRLLEYLQTGKNYLRALAADDPKFARIELATSFTSEAYEIARPILNEINYPFSISYLGTPPVSLDNLDEVLKAGALDLYVPLLVFPNIEKHAALHLHVYGGEIRIEAKFAEAHSEEPLIELLKQHTGDDGVVESII